jgi:hypothetical protein
MDASGQIVFDTKCMTTLQNLFQQRKVGSWPRSFEGIQVLVMLHKPALHSTSHRHARHAWIAKFPFIASGLSLDSAIDWSYLPDNDDRPGGGQRLPPATTQ